MRRINRKRPIDYILPFLVILGLGVIAILGYQLWKNYEKQGKADAYFYIAEGNAKILPYGQTSWDNAFSGTKLLIGDALKTTSLGKVVMIFFNGTIIRMGSDTAITLTDLSKDTESEKIVMTMDNGVLWVNGRKSPGVKDANYEVRTSHIKVRAKETVFEVESNTAEVVRVLNGQVAVDVMVKTGGTERVAQTIDVGVGQEIVLDAATLKAFEDNQNPSVLMAISDQFKTGDWYLWNTQEDKNPTAYSAESAQQPVVTGTQSSANVSGSTQQTTATAGQLLSTQQTQAGTSEVISGTGAPVITAPAEDARTVAKGPVTISGTVPDGTRKVVVEQVIDGKTDSYTLGKFKAGDTNFVYNVSEKLGNLIAGDNTYSFYAFDSKGNKSDAAEIIITLNAQKVVITDKLEAPVVLKYNGSDSSVVDTGTVTVAGTIKGAEKVVVNGYTLSKFTAGSTTWSYIAKESLGNLQSGQNVYEVYGVDPDGNKSDTVKFTITYNKTAASASTQQTVPAGGTQQSAPAGGTQPGFGF